MKIEFKTIIILLFSPFLIKAQNTIYVSPAGIATNTGTSIGAPTTLQQAINTAAAGTIIYIRGGTYAFTTKISIPSSKNGQANGLIKLWAFAGDPRPKLDFSAMTVSSSNRGIELAASYWHVKGIDIFKAGDNGLNVSGSNNIIEFCTFSENGDTGLQMGGGASNNQVINCDSYYNVDPTQGNADGFAVKLDVGTGNSFKGCRAWQNSDDGWDGYMRPSDDVSTTLDNCWAFKNGYLKDGSVAVSGNGNGFKMGGSDTKLLRHNMTLTHCLAFQNTSNGYDQNSNLGNMTIHNCTAFNNGRNYRMDLTLATDKVASIKNCISAGIGLTVPGKTTVTSSFTILPSVLQATNSWSSGFTVANADFLSVDPTPAFGPRNADGSLPNITFMHLTQTSTLRNRGVDVGLSFNGTAPDLGAFETTENVGVKSLDIKKEGIIKRYPSVSNEFLTIETLTEGDAILKIINIEGQTILTKHIKERGLTNTVFDVHALTNGIYLLSLETVNGSMVVKFVKD
jgi:Right handed beta helix region/Secretion system C-terminal sorting domain